MSQQPAHWLRRFFAAAVTALLVSAGVAIATASPALANTGDYPWWDAPCRYSNGGTSCSNGSSMYDWYMNEDGTPGYNTTGENYDQWGYQYRNCTSFVAWKLSSLGVTSTKLSGLHHGGQWHVYAPGKGLTVSSTPEVGAAAVKPATYNSDGSLATFGHVAYVSGYNSTTGEITVEEYNRSGNGAYGTWTGQPSTRGFTKFVYFASLMTNPPGSGGTTPPGAPSSNNYVAIRKESIMYAKAGLDHNWSTLTGQAADIQVAGNRFAHLTSWGSLFVKEGLDGNWSELIGDVDQYVITPKYIVVRKGSTMYAKAGLDHNWSVLTGSAADIQAAGERFAYRTSDGGLYVKEGLSGNWFWEGANADQYVITPTHIARRSGSTMYAKAGLNDNWSTLTGQAADIQVAGNRFAHLTSWGSLFVKEGLDGNWSELAGSVDQYLLTAG